MSRDNIFASPTKLAPVVQIKKVLPKINCNSKKCEVQLNIGLFFDGTNNNMGRDLPSCSDTNIARLFNRYIDGRSSGYERVYIPGVGTRFPEIGEEGETKSGTAWALGCEARVIFGLLAVFNSLYYRSLKSHFFDEKAVLALCRNGSVIGDNGDSGSLAKFDMSMGLLTGSTGNINIRNLFLRRQADFLKGKMKSSKPRVVECFVDVFGFSRGAAEARVFCNWLNELLVDGCLAGVPLQFRFVGIIDTVASAGFWSGIKALAINSTGGHGAWASAESLRIPASVQNCVHMLAMHELRRNFPLDAIGSNGKLQSGWVQHAYPGAHSDVGGGYRPGELGLAAGDDSKKLSQIPLNHMLACGVAAGVPLVTARVTPGSDDPFAIHPDLQKAFDDFISHATLTPRPMYEWLQPYINWRWQMRNRFHETTQVKQAIPIEKEILISFNKSLINDAAAMKRTATMSIGRQLLAICTDAFFTGARKDMVTTSLLEPEARSIYELAEKSKPTPPPLFALFDSYVHDSLAGFNLPNLELPGYWRYRKIFMGSDEHTIAADQDAEVVRNVA